MATTLDQPQHQRPFHSQRGKNGLSQTKDGGRHLNREHVTSEFAKETYQMCRELVFGLLVDQNVRLNGHTNGVVSPYFSSEELKRAYESLIGACRQFMKQHSRELELRVKSLDISDTLLYSSYHQALNKVFEDGVINWGRIIAMLCFTESLAYRVHKEGMSVRAVESLIAWQSAFIVECLQNWIVQQHGWVSLTWKCCLY